eukprot:TRINITY_DN20827_c0_g1_i1.p1 TRINITY_DN20827_c0_g1~~TRINITY_DN20827_c0_g1_i1.p1  ORF type:complete len:266 (+),score=34.77 TRINITY_DN20827_c0_g1_i1:43-840(+)
MRFVTLLLSRGAPRWGMACNVRMQRRLKGSSPVEEYRKKEAAKEERAETAKDRELALKWIQYGLMAILGPLSVWWAYNKHKRPQSDVKTSEVRTVGKALVGGQWTLVTTEGKPITSADLHGKYPIMYFGFTHCPEICPVELHRLSRVVDELRPLHPDKEFVPLFVSIDPVRDSLKEIKSYISEFHKDFIGLVGTPKMVEKMCKMHRIYFSMPTEDEALSGDYLVDHSIAIYFFDDKFEFMECFGSRFTTDEIVNKMDRLLNGELI